MRRDRNLRRASRRFEMMVHEGVPESPQPMYQVSTYGKTTPRFTGQASDIPATREPIGRVAAVVFLRDGTVVWEGPDASEAKG
jgi:hypothetical protein